MDGERVNYLQRAKALRAQGAAGSVYERNERNELSPPQQARAGFCVGCGAVPDVLCLTPPYAVYCRACCPSESRPLDDDERCGTPDCRAAMVIYSDDVPCCGPCWEARHEKPPAEPAGAVTSLRELMAADDETEDSATPELPAWTRGRPCPKGHNGAWRWTGPDNKYIVCGACQP